MLTGGGTDDRSVRTAKALMDLGEQVWLAGPSGREYTRIVQDLGVPFEAVPLGPLKLPLIFKTAGLIRRHDIQIIHARHGRDYWPAVMAAKLSGRGPKIVLSRHLAKSPGSWPSRRFLLGQCDAFVAVSHFVAKVLREGDADPGADNEERHLRPPMLGDHSRIHVVYGGFDMKLFRPADATAQRKSWGLEPQHYAFGVVGGYALPRGKGQPEFLEAAARIHSEVPHARFLIIGRGNMQAQLEAQIARLKLTGIASLTPYCHDMPAAMNALDCMVLPQVGTEAIPGVVLEALACGKPAIASDLDGIPEAFAAGNYGQLVKPGSIEGLAAAMKAWARIPPLDAAAKQVLHARIAERFSLERSAADLAALYASLLKPS